MEIIVLMRTPTSEENFFWFLIWLVHSKQATTRKCKLSNVQQREKIRWLGEIRVPFNLKFPANLEICRKFPG